MSEFVTAQRITEAAEAITRAEWALKHPTASGIPTVERELSGEEALQVAVAKAMVAQATATRELSLELRRRAMQGG